MVHLSWDKKDRLLRLFYKWVEIAYIKFGLHGLQAEIEFPSDWHENRVGWVRFGVGLASFAFAFPWKWTVPDEGQCSGPTYGFTFFYDSLHLHWGKCKGKMGDPIKLIQMPWGWRFIEHKILSDKETHDYTYVLKSGEVQKRKATIFKESRSWWRPWVPWWLYKEQIDVEFDGEVGERSGTWKGGCIGCGYDMQPLERPVDTLRRMESERVF